MRRSSISAIAAIFALAASLGSLDANASGFYASDRGVRPLGRGGAFVAGADDQHSFWYNPAGLADAPNGFLFDGSLILFDNRFERRSRPTGTTMDVVSPSVRGDATPLPIPTVVANHNFGVRGLSVALALFAPNAVLSSWPDRPNAPQRYSLIDLNGSLLALAGAYVAYRPHRMISFGVGASLLAGSFVSRLAMSSCPATIICQPEDPDWDANARLSVGPILSPSASAGIRFTPTPWLAFGLSGNLPHWVEAPATLAVRLPGHPFFDGARIEGDRATVRFMMAPIIRAGVQVKIPNALDIEVAFVWEGWSVHDRISLDPIRDASQPNGIRIVNARGIGIYEVGATGIQRGFRDAYSFRLGLERDQPLPNTLWRLIPRVGLAYETSATAPEYTSVLTFDTDKVLATIGLSAAYRRFRFDGVFAFAFANSVLVATEDARLFPTQPFRVNSQAPSYAINAGRYDLAMYVLGAGMRYQF